MGLESVNTTISIIGFGNIGKVICALLLPMKFHRFAINVMDTDPKVEGALLDFEQGLILHDQHEIHFNDPDLFNDSDFIFHCAGASVPKGKSRLFTCQESVRITESIFQNFQPRKEPSMIVVSNPVEIIATVLQRITGLGDHKIVGTGTMLDSIRMDHAIQKRGMKSRKVQSVLLGEHGSSVFLSKQLSRIDDRPLDVFFDDASIDELMTDVKQAAEKIKATQEATIYGVSYCAVRIFEQLLSDEERKFALSVRVPKKMREELEIPDVFLSLYTRIHVQGVYPDAGYRADEWERTKLIQSARLLASYLPEKYQR